MRVSLKDSAQQPAKVGVVGPNPIARSSFSNYFKAMLGGQELNQAPHFSGEVRGKHLERNRRRLGPRRRLFFGGRKFLTGNDIPRDRRTRRNFATLLICRPCRPCRPLAH